jgi:HlyD family secretion protein
VRARYWVWLAIVALIAVGIWRIDVWRNQPPEIPFAKVTRETLVSSVPTNGKVEPVQWATARAERPGAVTEILVHRGERVAKDAPLVKLDSSEIEAEKVAAQARITEIRAQLETMSKGGPAADLAEISSGLDRARLDLQTAQKNYDQLKRLEAKQAATPYDVAAAKERVDQAQLQIKSFETKKAALVSAPDRAATEARLSDAEASLRLADERLRQSVVRAPIGGIVYQFDLKQGAYLNAGDLVATIGRLDQVNVTVYVDEPDLGRVGKGMPVTITWDGLPGREWKGAVDKTPTQIVPLGSRQVGEVVCLINNPNDDLLPGTNVNVEILSKEVANVLSIPKEALFRRGGQTGVYLLEDDHIVWRMPTLGLSNTTRTQVSGLKEGDSVALPSDRSLEDGMALKPIYR